MWLDEFIFKKNTMATEAVRATRLRIESHEHVHGNADDYNETNFTNRGNIEAELSASFS
jgi:hypothetical protein